MPSPSLIFVISTILCCSFGFDTEAPLKKIVANRRLRSGLRHVETRFKRSSGSTLKPPVLVEFDPNSFTNEKFRSVFSPLTGTNIKREYRGNASNITFKVKSKNPPAVRPVKMKRRTDEDDLAAFQLRINPMLPRRPIDLKNYSFYKGKDWCQEMCMVDSTFCAPHDTPTPRPTTCFPTKPTITIPLGQWCNLYVPEVPRSQIDMCACDKQKPSPTPYVHCKSSHYPEPCEFMTYKWTTEKCSPSKRVPEQCAHPPIPTPIPPRCDASRLKANGDDMRRKRGLYVKLKRAAGIKPRSKPRFRRSRKTLFLVHPKSASMLKSNKEIK